MLDLIRISWIHIIRLGYYYRGLSNYLDDKVRPIEYNCSSFCYIHVCNSRHRGTIGILKRVVCKLLQNQVLINKIFLFYFLHQRHRMLLLIWITVDAMIILFLTYQNSLLFYAIMFQGQSENIAYYIRLLIYGMVTLGRQRNLTFSNLFLTK